MPSDKPVIELSTQQWQNQKLGYSQKRNLRWIQTDILRYAKTMKKVGDSLRKMQKPLMQIADAIKGIQWHS